MSASALLTARSPSTAIAWATREALFVEIPCKNSHPYVTRYPLTVEGLQRALNVLLDTPEPLPRVAALAAHPSIRRPKVEFDASEREKVRDVLKGLKII